MLAAKTLGPEFSPQNAHWKKKEPAVEACVCNPVAEVKAGGSWQSLVLWSSEISELLAP